MTAERLKAVAREMVHSATGNAARNYQQVEEYRNMYAIANDLLSMMIAHQKEDERLHTKAMELMPIPIDLDNLDADGLGEEMKKCRDLCESAGRNVSNLWKDAELDANTIRMKLLMISWVLDTPEFGLGAGENLLGLAYAMAKERVLQLEHDEPYAKEEAADDSAE